MRWEPAIYEHKAALIGRGVHEVARSADLLAAALRTEHETYRADFLTVGVDVYNVEAEACGARVAAGGRSQCPEIPTPPWRLDALPGGLALPDVPAAGRFGLLLDAARRVRRQIGDAACLRVAASGALSIAAKLVGLNPLLMALAMEDAAAARLLDFAAELSEAWCRCIRAAGFDAIVFDSVACPPLISPTQYADVIAPLHRRVMDALGAAGQRMRPLVIGGDTTPIVAAMADAGANSVICDFPADAEKFAAALSGRRVTVRRNVNPQVLAADDDAIRRAGAQLAADLRCFADPVAGTGILPYEADPSRFGLLREAAEAAGGPASGR